MRWISVQCGSLRCTDHAPAPASKGAYLSGFICSPGRVCVSKKSVLEKGWVSWASCSKPISAYSLTETVNSLILVARVSRVQVKDHHNKASDSYVTLNLLCLGGNKQLFYFSFFLCFFPLSLSAPPLKPDSGPLQCGCSGSFVGKPVDYPNCFMTKAKPAITVLCHEEITCSQTDPDIHTHPIPEGWRERTHHSRRGPHHLLKPCAWESPRCTNIYKQHIRGSRCEDVLPSGKYWSWMSRML